MERAHFPGHDLVMETERLVLRPFAEQDFDTALSYYADPEFREMMEGDTETPITRDYLREAALYMSLWGWLFAVDLKSENRTIGEACLQRMNLERAQVQLGERVFRMPIGIWDKSLWGRGLGGEVVDRLLRYAFWVHGASRVCAMDVKKTNTRSQRLFLSRGFRSVREIADEQVVDFQITRAEYRLKSDKRSCGRDPCE